MKNISTILLMALLLWNCKGKTTTNENIAEDAAVVTEAADDNDAAFADREGLIGVYPIDDLDGDGKPEKIVLSGKPQDAGVFTLVQVYYSTGAAVGHSYEEGYDKITEPERFTKLSQGNAIVSNVFGGKECPYMLLLQFKGSKDAFLILEGYAYANANRLTVLNLQSVEGETVVLDEDFVLNGIEVEKSLPGYNQPAFVLVGQLALDQLLGQNEDGSYVKTYCPILTMPLAPIGKDAKLAYMKAYNEKHYLWDGAECSERKVFVPVNGKPYFAE